jgi:hypothetical protein
VTAHKVGPSIKHTHDTKETIMKNEYTSKKDNTAIAAVMGAIIFAIAGTMFGHNHAAAETPDLPIAQKMDTIVVTAKSGADVTLAPIVVTASREHRAAH